MVQVIEKKNGIYRRVYHFDHLFKVGNNAPTAVRNTIKSNLIKVYEVQQVLSNKPFDEASVVITTSKSNLIKVVFVDSRTTTKQYTLIGTIDQFNKYFDHGFQVTDLEYTEQLLQSFVLGYCLTKQIVNKTQLYDTIKHYKVRDRSTISLNDLYRESIVDTCLQYKKPYEMCLRYTKNQYYQFKFNNDVEIDKLFQLIKLESLKDIDLWLINDKYLKSNQYKQDCKLLGYTKMFDKLVLASALIDHRLQCGSLIPIKINNLSNKLEVQLIDGRNRRVVPSYLKEDVVIKGIRFGIKYNYCLLILSNQRVFRIGSGRDVGNNTLHFSIKSNDSGDDRDSLSINRIALDKLFTIVDGLYQQTSYKNSIGQLIEILAQIEKASQVEIQVDDINNTQDMIDMYDRLTDNEKVFGYNVINTLHNFIQFLQTSEIDQGIIFAYIDKLNKASQLRLKFNHVTVD